MTRVLTWIFGVATSVASLVVPSAAFGMSAKPASVVFGSVGVGSSKTKPITINIDPGYAVASASGGGINPPFSPDIGACGSQPTCKVNETFAPTSLGTSDATLTISECPIAGGACVDLAIPVHGTGGAFAAKAAPVAFGSVAVGTTKTESVTLKMDPGYGVAIFGGAGALNPPFSLDIGTCSDPSGQPSCKLNEAFTPTTLGTFDVTLNVFECPLTGGACIPLDIPFHATSGVFAAKPVLTAFGSVAVGRTKTKSVTLKIDPGYQVTIASGGGINVPFSFDLGTCAGAAGQPSCKVNETFAPTGLGTFDTTLTIYECPITGGPCIPLVIPVQAAGGV
jgi:hypothetical protein